MSVSGRPQSLEIPLRNLSLLTTAAAHFAHLPELHLAMGTTADNHFSDGSRAFFDACETGKGWAECSAYCQPDAGFAALPNLTNPALNRK